jgi:hypothetical protein
MALDLLAIFGAGVAAVVVGAVVFCWLTGWGGGGRDDVDG